jgi:hypothetical protein
MNIMKARPCVTTVSCIALLVFQATLVGAARAPRAHTAGYGAHTAAGPLVHQAELDMGDSAYVYDFFGQSVALSAIGKMALVGVPGRRVNGRIGTGAAEVFRLTGARWSGPVELSVGPTAFGNTAFGWSVALSADGATALVGEPDHGSAEVFRFKNGKWGAQAKLDLPAGPQCGEPEDPVCGYRAVALSSNGNTALLGDPRQSIEGKPLAGGAGVFRFIGGKWGKPTPLSSEATASKEDEFGVSVALSSDGATALVGECGGAGFCVPGWVHVFRFANDTWSDTARLGPGPKAAGTNFFGDKLALSSDGNTVLVRTHSWGGPGIEFLEFFTYSNGSWAGPAEVKLVPRHPGFGGDALALSGDGRTALVGAPGVFHGGVQVFRLAGGAWRLFMGMGEYSPRSSPESLAVSGDGDVAIAGDPSRVISGQISTGAADVFAADPTGVVVTIKASGLYGSTPALTGLSPRDPRIAYNPPSDATGVTGALTCQNNADQTTRASHQDIVSCSGLSDPGHTIVYDYVNSEYTVLRAHTKLAYTGPRTIKHGKTVSLSAGLRSEAGTGIGGRKVLMQIGAWPTPGGPVQTCWTRPTSSQGVGSCVIKKVRTVISPNVVKMHFTGTGGDYFNAGGTAQVRIVK